MAILKIARMGHPNDNEEITRLRKRIEALEAENTDWAREQLAILRRVSPTSVAEMRWPSTPQAFADDIRRRNSSTRSSVRAISTPPHVTLTPISMYWRWLSSVSIAISLL